jgi:hypothetical protein
VQEFMKKTKRADKEAKVARADAEKVMVVEVRQV